MGRADDGEYLDTMMREIRGICTLLSAGEVPNKGEITVLTISDIESQGG